MKRIIGLLLFILIYCCSVAMAQSFSPWVSTTEIEVGEVAYIVLSDAVDAEVTLSNKNSATLEEIIDDELLYLDIETYPEDLIPYSELRVFRVIGLKKGDIQITVKQGKEKAAVKIKAIAVQVKQIVLDKKSATYEVGEKVQLKATVVPQTAENKKVTWSTSDKKVATVNNSGVVTVVGVGKAVITAKAANGVQASITITGKKEIGKLSVSASAKHGSYNSVGSSWTYGMQVNGKNITKGGTTIQVKVGDVVTLYAEAEEHDKVPDRGSSTRRHTITEKDLMNGFTETLTFYVEENRGRYSGRRCEWTMTFTFKVTK